MITPRGTQPDKSLYAIGGGVIQSLKSFSKEDCAIDDVYRDFRKEYPRDVSFSYFLYAIDWLFLLGLVEKSATPNKIKKCF